MNKGRPKSKITKTQINLTIEKKIIGLMKKYSHEQNKSLSQITEELYKSLLKDEKMAAENPEELMAKLKAAIPIVENLMKQKEAIKKDKGMIDN